MTNSSEYPEIPHALRRRLRLFSRRVRLARAWRGLTIGIAAAGAIDLIWAALDWAGLAFTDWVWMGTMVLFGALLGAVVESLRKVNDVSLADSIDRRASLENRVASATQSARAARTHESNEAQGGFEAELLQDAQDHLIALKPAKLYPIRAGKLQVLAVALCALAASVFLLGNTPILLSEQAKKDRAKVQESAKKVERVEREAFGTPQALKEMTQAEKSLADELNRLKRDEEKARMSPEEARQRENQLSQKADDLARQSAEDAKKQLDMAATAQQQLERQAMDAAGLQSVPESMANLSDEQRDAALSENQAEQASLQKQLEAAQKRLNDLERRLARKDLSNAERKRLEMLRDHAKAQVDALKHELSEKKNEERAIKLSREAQAVFAKMAKDPLYKQIQDLMRKLSKDLKSGSPGSHGNSPKLTDAEREEMRKQLEELARQLKDDKAMKAYLQALLNALKSGQVSSTCNGICLGLGLNLGPHMWGPSGPGQDWMTMPYDTGQINKTDKPVPGGGKTTTTSETGDLGRAGGPETYIEIKAPATVGNRSSVPYVTVLPSYKKKAEEALHQQRIPKEEQKRVREYFESLNGGK